MKKGKKSVFSVVKAVKANARARVGTPPPQRVLPDPRRTVDAEPRHKETLSGLLNRTEEDA